ncbi:class I SAM-dependent methyltransferase [Buchnera aphidicola (Neophyllaphis podocarpi)]|uniref:class I SAM-dependent methyltransferase n=1 Tax=Buchnera aphidicola TaxID=9 RepID=UPI0031B80A21
MKIIFTKPFNNRYYNLVKKLNISKIYKSNMELIIKSDFIYIKYKNKHSNIFFIDFNSKKMNYRCNLANINNEFIAKSVGIKNKYFPKIIDATAGLGNDSFILSYLGCNVIMIERNPIIYLLLRNALDRTYLNATTAGWTKKRLRLIYQSSFEIFKKIKKKPDVIYLDPMFPITNKKKSKSKKEIELLKKIVGEDKDADTLLKYAISLASTRVVVKRPLYASPLNNIKTSSFIKTGNYRFDIYFNRKK